MMFIFQSTANATQNAQQASPFATTTLSKLPALSYTVKDLRSPFKQAEFTPKDNSLLTKSIDVKFSDAKYQPFLKAINENKDAADWFYPRLKNCVADYLKNSLDIKKVPIDSSGYADSNGNPLQFREYRPTKYVSRDDVIAYTTNMAAYLAERCGEFMPLKEWELLKPSTWFTFAHYEFDEPKFKSLVEQFNKTWENSKQKESMIAETQSAMTRPAAPAGGYTQPQSAAYGMGYGFSLPTATKKKEEEKK